MGISRRNFFYGTAASAAMVVAASGARASTCAMPTKERQAALSPQGVVDELMAGKQRFVSGTMVNCDLNAQVMETATGQ